MPLRPSRPLPELPGATFYGQYGRRCNLVQLSLFSVRRRRCLCLYSTPGQGPVRPVYPCLERCRALQPRLAVVERIGDVTLGHHSGSAPGRRHRTMGPKLLIQCQSQPSDDGLQPSGHFARKITAQAFYHPKNLRHQKSDRSKSIAVRAWYRSPLPSPPAGTRKQTARRCSPNCCQT